MDMDNSEAENVSADEAHAAPSAPAVKKTVEAWAEEKKLLPQFFPPPNFRAPGGAAGPGGVARIVMSGLTGPRPNAKHYLYAAARMGEQWPEGKELTEADFDAAVTKHNSHVCR